MNRQQMLSRLAFRGWDVTYSTGARSGRGGVTFPLPFREQIATEDGVRIVEAGGGPALTGRDGRWDDYVARRLWRRVNRLVPGASVPDLAMVFHPQFEPYVRDRGAAKLVFYIYDDYALQPGWARRNDHRLRTLVDAADLIVASSPRFPETMALPGERTLVLPNGVDESFFHGSGHIPDILAGIPEPRIGYTGWVNRKLDLALIDELSRRHADFNWVIVGPIQEFDMREPRFREAVAVSGRRPNVHFLGRRPHAELPALMAHMTVNLMCYDIGSAPWMKHAYPLKLNEYLASGAPVVSSPIDVVRAGFTDLVATATTPDEWSEAICRAVEGAGPGDRATRIARARESLWEHRADELDGQLTALLDH
ncbi:MAG: glycosyltransferase [Longimicrobiales bacterium]|nr:glycosyltransferase [Longimicrobiales bacterium]